MWAALTPAVKAYAPLRGEAKCSVIVLGGGVTGALLGYRLAQNGISVALVEKDEIGRGSTTASTGLLQYEVDTPLSELIGKVGQENAVHAYRRGLAAVDAIGAIIDDLGSDCGFARRDSLYFASSRWHFSRLKREYECRRQFGFAVDFLSRQQLASISSIQAPGAIRSRGDAEIDPYRFTRALVDSAARQGMTVYTQTRVVDIQERATDVYVETDDGCLIADMIIYATGYDSHRYLGQAVGSLHSTYALATEAASVPTGWPDQCLIWETARPYFYARQTAAGHVIMGGGDTSFSTDHKRDGLVERKIEKLIARFRQLFPEAQFVPAYGWAGTFAETKDGLAYIGQPPERPRAYFALGYGGNGITFSVIAAQTIVDLILRRPSKDAEVFRFGR